MKQIYSFLSIAFLLLFVSSSSLFAATGWFNDFLLIQKNGGASVYYWVGSNPGSDTEFNGYNFGTVTSLKITGSTFKYWSDSQDRTGGSFFYKIMSADNTTQIVAPVETVWFQSPLGGNDYQGITYDPLNLLTGLAPSTTYKLHIWAKSWGSNQGDSWLSNGSLNYVATFTTDVATKLQLTTTATNVFSKNGNIVVDSAHDAVIEIYSLTGQLLQKTTTANGFSKVFAPATYIVKVNGNAKKITVN